VSRGLDRDRVVDETGNQTVVFGRRGSRPFNASEFDAFLRRGSELYRVEDVSVRQGALQTASGMPLMPTLAFVAPQPEAAPPAAEEGRLVRRPAD
jgi:hypothetical protein